MKNEETRAIIEYVKPNSPAAYAGVRPGDRLLAVDGRGFADLIDLSYLLADERPELTVEREGVIRLTLEKTLDEDSGIEFSRAVFDGIRLCRNNCIFCFVAQMPPAMRPSLYIKDDDYRLSFLSGNFITLTNLSEADKQRIKKLRLSPLYVSVHAADPATRRLLMGNEQAGGVLAEMRRLAADGIVFHTQVVICPGLNDKEILEDTYNKLLELSGNVLSVAVVPVGLTRFCRDKTGCLRPVTVDEARAIVKQVERWQDSCRPALGRNFIYAADEFYIMAGYPFPPAEAYDGFIQYENGVGICRKFIEEWQAAAPPPGLATPCHVVCGCSASGTLAHLLREAELAVGVKHYLLTADNDFFGRSVTVTGLLTGRDIINAAQRLSQPPRKLILPGIAFKNKQEKIFLDDITLEYVEAELGVPIRVAWDAAGLKRLLWGE